MTALVAPSVIIKSLRVSFYLFTKSEVIIFNRLKFSVYSIKKINDDADDDDDDN